MAISDDDGAMDVGPLEASVYPAVEAFILAARGEGLGTCLTTVARIHDAEVLGVVGVPAERYTLAALLPVGVPSGRWGLARRRPAPTITHWDTWGNRH
jgi:nitroreductase